MLLNCGVGEDTWASLGLQGDQPVHFKGDQSWDFFGRNDAKAETPILWPPDAKSWLTGKDPDAEKDWGLRKIEGRRRRENRGWDGWMTSPTQWIWVWVNSRSWWWTGRPGVLQSTRSQSLTQPSNWAELNQEELKIIYQLSKRNNPKPITKGSTIVRGGVHFYLVYKKSLTWRTHSWNVCVQIIPLLKATVPTRTVWLLSMILI